MMLELTSQYIQLLVQINTHKNIVRKVFIFAVFGLIWAPINAMEIPKENSTLSLKEKLHKELIENHSRVEEKRSKCGLPESEFCELEDIALETFSIPKILQMTKITSTLTKTEDLSFRRLQPGGYSDIIYMVFVPKKSLRNPSGANCFVIKRHKWENAFCSTRKEQTPQKTIQDLSQVNKIILPKLTEIKNSIAIAETFQSAFYFDFSGRKRYLSIIEGVPGKDIEKWISLCQKKKIPSNQLNWIMNLTGEALGLLHYTLATEESKKLINRSKIDLNTFKTIIHGDLNLSNILFDSSEDKVYLIDTSAMADSLEQRKSPLYDLLELLFRAKIIFLECTNFTSILNESFERLICGYCEAFPFPFQRDFKTSILNSFKKVLREGKQRIKDSGYRIDFNDAPTHLDRFIFMTSLCNLPKDQMVRYLDRDNWTY